MEDSTDSESETINQAMRDNGSSSTGELRPSELRATETWFFPTKLDKDSELELPPSLDNTETHSSRESTGSEETEETLETMEESASMYTEDMTIT